MANVYRTGRCICLCLVSVSSDCQSCPVTLVTENASSALLFLCRENSLYLINAGVWKAKQFDRQQNMILVLNSMYHVVFM